MSRDAANIYHRPLGTEGKPDTPVESARYNTYTSDVSAEFNKARPVNAGGTGGTTAVAARAAFRIATFQQPVDDFNTYTFEHGYLKATATTANSPVAGHRFAGKVFMVDSSNGFLEVRDLDDPKDTQYVRQMTAGAWSAWAVRDYNGDVTKTPVYSDDAVLYDQPQSKTAAQQAQARANIGAINASGGDNIGAVTINGNLTVAGDIYDYRASGGPGQGIIWLGNTGHYLQWDGSNYIFAGANVYASNGRLYGTNDFSAPMPLSGGTMTGTLTTAYAGNTLQYGGAANSIVVQGSPHAYMSFVKPGFGSNIGIDTSGQLYMGGWSHGNVAYRFWTTRDFSSLPSSGVRLVAAGATSWPPVVNYTPVEPIANAITSARSFWSTTTLVNYRYCQFFYNGNWNTMGYA